MNIPFKHNEIVTIYFILLFLSVNAQKWCNKKWKFTHQREKISESKLVNKSKNDTNENCIQYDPGVINNHLCNNKCSKIPGKKSINPYKNLKSHLVIPKEFSSVCLKCATCLAIAKHLTDLKNDYFKYPDDIDIQDWKHYVKEILEYSCVTGFKNYDLRQYNGQTFLAPVSLITQHMPTKMDGKWTTKLRDVCKLYIDNLDIDFLYNTILSGPILWEDFLCRNQGIYRDCVNMSLEPVHVPEMNNMFMSICILCEPGNEKL